MFFLRYTFCTPYLYNRHIRVSHTFCMGMFHSFYAKTLITSLLVVGVALNLKRKCIHLLYKTTRSAKRDKLLFTI